MECHNFQNVHQSKVAHQVSWDPDQSHTAREGICRDETGQVDSYMIQADTARTFNTSERQSSELKQAFQPANA